MNYAYLSHIRVNDTSAQPVYIQLRDAFRELITGGILKGNNKIPSSRILSNHFGIHRQTVIAAMNELLAEGWLISKERKGIFVNDRLPEIQPWRYGIKVTRYPSKASFKFNTAAYVPAERKKCLFGFDDGYPDIRIAPYTALSKAYTQTLAESTQKNIVTKIALSNGSLLLRQELAKMMSTYRGLAIDEDNILLTHGSQMSIFLAANRIISHGDNVVVTKPNYKTANNCFLSLGARILEVNVDSQGMNVDELEKICRKKKIRCIYITSHHHHPTTVTLAVDRRLKLLQLAHTYGFAIIEDDYDYDYHYENKPLLPLASNDKYGSVIYIGSFSKILSQAFRIGYIIAPKDFIEQVAIYRRLVDRQGDQVLEDAFGKLFRQNIIKNHVRKAVNLYKERRNQTYSLLQSELGKYLQCDLPEGGLAFWAHFDRRIPLLELSARCSLKGLLFPDGTTYNYDKTKINACRLGFASMNEKELSMAIDILRVELKKF